MTPTMDAVGMLVFWGTLMGTVFVTRICADAVSRRNEANRSTEMQQQLEEDLRQVEEESLTLEGGEYLQERLVEAFNMANTKTPEAKWRFALKPTDEISDQEWVGYASNRYQEVSGVEMEKHRSRTTMLSVTALSVALYAGLGISMWSVGAGVLSLLVALKIQRVVGKTRTSEGKETLRYRHLLYPEEYLWLNREVLRSKDMVLGELLEMRVVHFSEDLVKSLQLLEELTKELLLKKQDFYRPKEAFKTNVSLSTKRKKWIEKMKNLAGQQQAAFLKDRKSRSLRTSPASLSLNRAKFLKEKMDEIVADPSLQENLKEKALLTLEQAERRYEEEQAAASQANREWQAIVDLATVKNAKSMMRGDAIEILPRR